MKIKKLGIALLLLLVPVFTSIPVKASGNDLSNITMEVYLQENGSAKIVETWDIYVSDGTELYKEMKNMVGSTIYDFYVTEDGIQFDSLHSWDINTSRENKKYKSGIIQNGNDYELCFGVGDYGQHEFKLYYTIDNFVEKYEDIYGMNYQLISKMNIMPDWFIINIYCDLFTSDTKMYAFGFEGSIYLKEEAGKYFINLTNILDDGSYGRIQYANVLSGFFGATFTSANLKHSDRSFLDMVNEATVGSDYENNGTGGSVISPGYEDNSYEFGIGRIVFTSILPIGIFIIVLYIIISSSKDRNSYSGQFQFTDGNNELLKKADINYFRDIPCDKDLYLFYYVVVKGKLMSEEEAKSGMLSAILLTWIRNGYITFVKGEKKGVFSKKDTFSIDFSQPREFETDIENTIYEYFTLAAGKNGVLENKEFEKWCRRNYEKMDSWFTSLMLYSERCAKKQHYVEIQEVPSKFLFFNTTKTVRLYTPSFREELYRAIGFQKFLKEFSSLNEKKVLEVMLWEDYLIFASVLGLAEQVEKEIGVLYPEFAEQSNLDIYYTTMATRVFVYQGVRSATRAMAAANDSYSGGGGGSSSFGGGGGSFSGGGGGGVR